ncbi:1,4-alpha-glucan branching protein domain-containing protein [Brevibacillus sp. SYSU BS000544]|uniref:1,4-alpha-glucan branching protein domain-containing protein n=1 Tax=Brevibacillus sp. SYSU BS000544 TaxID=3416443 RepID=UPI003CE4EEB6
MNQGYLSLVLHAHLPYVRHAERDDYLEERWVYEAMVESYVPLLLVWEKLMQDNIDFRMTFSLSPTLLSMLVDPLIQERARRFLANRLELAVKEGKRTANHPAENKIARMYIERLREIAAYCNKYNYNLIPAFLQFVQSGKLELITSAATHAFLPLMETEESIRAQIMTGIQTFEKIVGFHPKGIWLPECGYTPGVDRLLREAGITYFFIDSHGVRHATPKPERDLFAPLMTEYGVAAFARDPESSEQVWSSCIGYPGDYDYREYYRDIGFDLDEKYVTPYIHPSGVRIQTGIKYHRVTGKDGTKELYNPDAATEKAATHAGHFLGEREKQVQRTQSTLDRPPLFVAPYDAELYGHWWYEGTQFLDFLIRKISCDSNFITMITPSEYLTRYKQNDYARLPMCSWGRNGYSEVWLNEKNDWIYRHLHQAERRMIECTTRFQTPTHLENRVLQQMARELMLAQSSDWAFMMDNQSMVDYAIRRTHDHLVSFMELSEQLQLGEIDEFWLRDRETNFPIFQQLNPQYYLPKSLHRLSVSQNQTAAGNANDPSHPRMRVLMLSWEYPPNTVGGLSRAVYELSNHLTEQNVEVHVITSHVEGESARERINGVTVYRVRTYCPPNQSDFMDWVFQLNLVMVDEVERLMNNGLEIDLIHAHDWLVAFAANELKSSLNKPLITTIHAMEHGRNAGIHTELQANIHQIEQTLTSHSDHLIACSHYMADQMVQHLGVQTDNVSVIPNGVSLAIEETDEQTLIDIRQRIALPEEKIIFYVGRLVREKGVHLLLEAAPFILREHPEAKFVIAGKGPMLDELMRQAEQSGIKEKVLFAGFIDDPTRNAIFQLADAAVFPSLYEPFGIVALEASIYRTPLLVADTGGLAEIISHGVNGVKMYPGDVQSLVTQMNWLLAHPTERRKMAERSYQSVVTTYNWENIARETLGTYHLLLPEAAALSTT